MSGRSVLAAAVLLLLAAGCGAGGTRHAGAPEAAGAKEAAGAPAATPPDGAVKAASPESEAATVAATAAPGEPNRREVVLFFQRAADDALGPERRKILLTDSIADQARQIVSELIAGPSVEGLLPTVPKRTALLGFYLDRAGTAYVDLSEEFAALHPGGSAEEVATVFSIVDSLTYNLPEVKRVRFLVAGEERESLKNHLDLRRAYLKDMSIVRLKDGV